MFRCALAFSVVISVVSTAIAEPPITLKGKQWSVTIEAETLHLVGHPTAGDPLTLSAATTSRTPTDLATTPNSARWKFPADHVAVDITLQDDDTLIAHFTSTEPGSFEFPLLPADPAYHAYILPFSEGAYVPVDDAIWAKFLEDQGPLNTTSDISTPFWGIDCGQHTLTYVLTNQFNNEFAFHAKDGKLQGQFSHIFTRNNAIKEYSVRIALTDPSPVAPAKLYRKYLIDAGQFVSMADKIKQTPDAAKLLGAAHVYLWGNGLISRQDLTNAKALSQRVLEQSKAAEESYGKHLFSKIDLSTQLLLVELSTKQWVDNYDKSRLADGLNAILKRDDCATLQAAYPDLLKPVETWGDGLSPKMIKSLTDAGFDRLWLGSADWAGLRNHPDTVQKAIAAGYLIGPYDSFHSIHKPGATDTWETAQFEQALYDTGAITKADGTKKTGFKKRGFILNCAVARPYVEKRVTSLMNEFKCNSWFIDCDADGELFDDYSPEHPATMEQDKDARMSRMAWIRDTFHAVIGSERGASLAASTIHFGHGMMTPVIGWGDPDLTGKQSPYYLGSYYPPDAPACFFKQVPMKPEYQHIFVDPRFRLPLFQTIFNDSVIATHHWSSGSLKFKDAEHERELLELLYDVPPLYHLNLEALAKQKDQMLAHYAFFSPIHRQAALLPMTDFKWLTPDHLVQKTTFGADLEMIVNFAEEPFKDGQTVIPARSAVARDLKTNATSVYSPH